MAPSAPAVLAQEVTSDIRTHLDNVEKLAPGRGKLDLGGYVRGFGDTGVAGGFLDYEHRITPSTSMFGQGNVGYGWGTVTGLDYQATAGLRMRF